MASTTADIKSGTRRPPFRTCGIAVLSIGQRAFLLSQDLPGPIGTIIRIIAILAKLLTPIIYVLQYQWLTILSIHDNYYLASENTIETLFPPSAYIFNKIDIVVGFIDNLPEKFDDFVNKFPMYIHRVSFPDWVRLQAISWLNLCVAILTHWGSQLSAKEKEIMIDSNISNESPTSDNIDGFVDVGKFPPESTDMISASKGATYKDVIRKGRGKDEINDNVVTKENKEEEGKGVSSESLNFGEDILELFDSGWLMKPSRDDSGGWLSRTSLDM